jgi:hypothetical protein
MVGHRGRDARSDAESERSPEFHAFSDALARELVSVAPPGWRHIRAEIESSGRGEAFAVTAKGSHWLAIPDRVGGYVRTFRSTSAGWTKLTVDIDPDVPAVLAFDSRPETSLVWVSRALIGISVVCLVAAVAVALFSVLRPAPPVIPVDVAPPVSAAQHEAEQLVRDWYDDDKLRDPASLRQLVCANPSGLVAEELANVESGSTSRGAVVRVEGFTDFVDNGATAQIKVYYTGRPLTPAAATQIENREEGYFIWTFVFIRENGQLRMCGG